MAVSRISLIYKRIGIAARMAPGLHLALVPSGTASLIGLRRPFSPWAELLSRRGQLPNEEIDNTGKFE